jgi:hypothetical protein
MEIKNARFIAPASHPLDHLADLYASAGRRESGSAAPPCFDHHAAREQPG